MTEGACCNRCIFFKTAALSGIQAEMQTESDLRSFFSCATPRLFRVCFYEYAMTWHNFCMVKYLAQRMIQ